MLIIIDVVFVKAVDYLQTNLTLDKCCYCVFYLDLSFRYLYFTDWGLKSYIGRIGMDGTNYSKVITSKLGWPNGITLDYVTNKIWWVDAHLDCIE